MIIKASPRAKTPGARLADLRRKRSEVMAYRKKIVVVPAAFLSLFISTLFLMQPKPGSAAAAGGPPGGFPFCRDSISPAGAFSL
jgi:hypothetical protein